MADRSSRPHHCLARTPKPTERRIVKVRITHRLGPTWIAAQLGLPASTVYRVLRRCGCPPLAHLDRATGHPIRRYEHGSPGGPDANA
ncbi:hypothetical protein GCM10010411_44800 [Actinomadura fulvescens]|uniref:Helix-turn-helix domain-containing protein n=1 Tax=Actinomadura fulvescens TaxID=46160 RepID=A0ABP6CAQ8_9ACTN